MTNRIIGGCGVVGPLFSTSLPVHNTFATAWGLVCYKRRIHGKTKCYKMEIEHLTFATTLWCTPFFSHFSGEFAGQSSSHISCGEHCKMKRITNAGWKQCIYINTWTQANCFTTFWMLFLLCCFQGLRSKWRSARCDQEGICWSTNWSSCGRLKVFLLPPSQEHQLNMVLGNFSKLQEFTEVLLWHIDLEKTSKSDASSVEGLI